MNMFTKSIGVLLGLLALHTNQASIVLSGNQSSGSLQALINRAQNVDGSLSQGFGQGTFPGTNYLSILIDNYWFLGSMSLQSDGKIVLVGQKDGHFAVVRFNADGSVDQTFGKTTNTTTSPVPGMVYINQSISGGDESLDAAGGVAIQEDGMIVVGSTRDVASNFFVAAARFTNDGMLDATFGQNGQGTRSIIPGTVFINQSIAGTTTTGHISDSMGIVRLQGDGKTVAGGASVSYNNLSGDVSMFMAFARFTSDGGLDEAFGKTEGNTASNIPGTVFINGNITGIASQMTFTDTNNLFDLVLRADGSIVAAGYAFYTDNITINQYVAALAALNADGTLITGFGATTEYTKSIIPGTVYIPTSIAGFTGVDPFPEDFFTRISLQNDGKIVAVGASGLGNNSETTQERFIVVRFDVQGNLDQNFGVTDAFVHSVIPGTIFLQALTDAPINQATGLGLQSDGSLVVGGLVTTDFNRGYVAALRFNRQGGLDPSFGFTSSKQGTISPFPGTVYISKSIAGSSPTYDFLNDIALTPEGSIIGAISARNQSDTGFYFGVVEFFNPQSKSSYTKTYTPAGAGVNC